MPTVDLTTVFLLLSPRLAVIPAGYYLKDPGQVAPCPVGEYKADTGETNHCTRCVEGVTTESYASTSPTDCKRLLPSYVAVSGFAGGAITFAAKCPYNHYCPGGVPSALWPTKATGDFASGAYPCPLGSHTQHEGATSAAQCSK